MPDQELREGLDRLRAERDRLPADDHENRERLDALIAQIEDRLAHPDDRERHHTLIERVRETVEEFEVEHPRATAILNDIMVTLANMGI